MNLRQRAARLLAATMVLTVAMVIGAACSSSPPPELITELDVPRFDAATGDLLGLVGTRFTAASLPAELGGGVVDALTGSSIINAEIDPGDEAVAMHWFVDGGHANVTVSDLVPGADSSPEWVVVDAFRLVLDLDMVVTVGTTVCAAPIHTYDWQHGEFMAVVNREQNTAFGAWTITAAGPTPYADLETLTCERFVP